MIPDRRIHATLSSGDRIIRLDRAGKWYRESEDGTVRNQITIKEAVQLASATGSHVYLRVPGGGRFDAMIRQWASSG